jgi:hypothetical protein
MRLRRRSLPARLHRRLPLPCTTLEHPLRPAYTPCRLRHNRYHDRILLNTKPAVKLPPRLKSVASSRERPLPERGMGPKRMGSRAAQEGGGAHS